MLNKRVAISFTAMTLLLTVSGCEKSQDDSQCIAYRTAYVTEVDGPTEVSANDVADLTISYYLDNGCGSFQQLEETSNGFTRTFSLKTKYQGCVCTQAIRNGELNYQFQASQPGTYYLKFVQPDKSIYTDSILVKGK